MRRKVRYSLRGTVYSVFGIRRCRMNTTCAAILSLSLLFALPALGQLPPGSIDPAFDAGSTITKPIYAATLKPDGSVIIAGDFTSLNGASATGVGVLQPNGSTSTNFTNGLQGSRLNARSVAMQLDGKILVGGIFVSNGGFFSTGLTRLNPDGTVDSGFSSPIGSAVYSMAVQTDGRVVLGGSFNSAGRRGIARLNTDGTIDNTFLYGLAGANGTVNSVAVQSDGKILVGGSFANINGSTHNGVARLYPDGSVDESFNANVTGVNAVAAQPDGKVVIGGTFTVVNGATRNRLARLNADGSLDTGFAIGTGADSTVYTLSIQSDNRILVGGAFITFNSSASPGLVRVNTTGSVDSTFSTGTDGIGGTLYSIVLQPNGQAIIGGSFTTVGGVLRNQIARLSTTGALDTTFANGPVIFAGNISCIVTQADGKILVNSVATTGVGRLLTNGSPDSTFLAGLTGANGPVSAVAVPQAGKILAAGQFTQFNGVPARALVRLDSSGGVDPTFQNGIGGTNGVISAMLLQPDGRILIGGAFSQVKGISRTNLARLNADGSVDNTFLGGVNGTVLSLSLQRDGKLLVGGNYTNVNGFARKNVARLNADGSLDRTFQEGMAGVSGPVYALAQQPDLKVVLAGTFTTANTSTVSHITRFLPDGSRDTNFSTGTISVGSLGLRTLSLQSDGKILVGGDFASISGIAFRNLARLRTNGTVEAFLQSPMGANGPVTALTVLDAAQMMVGGSFGEFNGYARSYIARIVYTAPAVPLETALNNSDLSWTNDLLAPWQGQNTVSHDLVAAAQSGSIADRESSSLTTSITGPGCLSFWWKVSSETNFDFLTFTCTGPGLTNQGAISGESGWLAQTVCIPEGVYNLKWTYSKDTSVSMGLDAAWIDEVVYTAGDLPPFITTDPASSTNFAGDPVTFTAAGSGIPVIGYQWLFNGVEIPDATNVTLTVTSLVPEQAGLYSLRVTNAYGEGVSAPAQLTVIPIRTAGGSGYGQADISLSTLDATAVAAGQFHSMVLKRDGSIYAWGNNGSGQCTVPPALGPAIAIAAGGYHSLAVKADGTVAGWGDNSFGQITPPAGLTNVLAVSAGMWHSLALKQDGTVIGWGDNTMGQAHPPAGLSNVIAIATGGTHSLALRADGIVIGWGGNLGPSGSYAGQASVPWALNNVSSIGAGEFHSLAIKNDGSIVGWGDNSQGQLTVPTNLPPAIAIVGGGGHTVAVLADGTAAAWGENYDGQCDLARNLTNVVAAAAGEAHTILLFGQRPPPPEVRAPTWAANEFSVKVPSYTGKFYSLEYKNSMAGTNWTSLPAVRGNGQVLKLADPGASGGQKYYRVRQW